MTQDFQQRVLYEQYKHRLDVREVLSHYGAKNVTEVISSDGTTELVHSCLLDQIEPHHANGDSHPSAWVNVEKKLYCCAVYWSGDVFHLIQKLEGKDSFGGVIPVIGDFLQGATRDAIRFREELEKLFIGGAYSIDLPSYSQRVLNPWMVSHPYTREERGISQKAHELLDIGFDERENRITFPVWMDQRLVGWQKRVIPDRPGQWPGSYPQWPKYRNSPGFPKSETLYAYDMAITAGADTAVVVESPMSVARAFSLGFHHGGLGVVGTFGAKVSRRQIDLLKIFPKVVVWFDDDPAGYAGERKIVENLYRHTDVQVVLPDQGKDMGDSQTKEEIEAKISSAIPAHVRRAEYDLEVRYLAQSKEV